MNPKCWLIILVLLSISGYPVHAQVPGFFLKDGSRKAVLSFSEGHNLIIIPVSINDGPPLNFLFDTGVKSNILFSKSIGDELGLTYTRKLSLIGADGQTVLTASVAVNNTMDVGEIRGNMQAILVLEEDFLELEKVIGVPVYGVIGYEFFKFNPIKINYDSKKLTFYRSSAYKWRPFGYRKIAIQIENDKPYIITKVKQVQGPDLEAKLLVDTGANHSLLLNRETTDEIVLPPNALESELGRSLGGDLFGFIGRIEKLQLGKLNFRKVLTSYPEETEFSNIIMDTGRMGSLGSELLRRLNLILDYPRERILFKKAVSFNEPFEYDMSGITVRLVSIYESRVYVSQVKEDSPAGKSGVQKFDEIYSINKIPIDFWKLTDINELLRSEEGTIITLGILRSVNNEVEELSVSFVLEKQL